VWKSNSACCVIIVAATLVYSHHGIYSEMFVVPVGALFAFTNIRANLPGAPDGFGKLFVALFHAADFRPSLNSKGQLSVNQCYHSTVFIKLIPIQICFLFSQSLSLCLSVSVQIASDLARPLYSWLMANLQQSFVLLLIVLYRRISQISGIHSNRRPSLSWPRRSTDYN
jgi:hypothetical protein